MAGKRCMPKVYVKCIVQEHQLQSLGITEAFHNWLTTHLKTCAQCVQCTYQCQTLRYCAIRNPSMEHNIVGPLLFRILINDLLLSVAHSMSFLYADDAKCLYNINSSRNIDNPQIDHFNVPHPHRAFQFLISFFKCSVIYGKF